MELQRRKGRHQDRSPTQGWRLLSPLSLPRGQWPGQKSHQGERGGIWQEHPPPSRAAPRTLSPALPQEPRLLCWPHHLGPSPWASAPIADSAQPAPRVWMGHLLSCGQMFSNALHVLVLNTNQTKPKDTECNISTQFMKRAHVVRKEGMGGSGREARCRWGGEEGDTTRTAPSLIQHLLCRSYSHRLPCFILQPAGEFILS